MSKIFYDYKTIKFTGMCGIRLLLCKWKYAGNVTVNVYYVLQNFIIIEAPCCVHAHPPPPPSPWKLSKFAVLKNWGKNFCTEALRRLDVSVYLLQCEFC